MRYFLFVIILILTTGLYSQSVKVSQFGFDNPEKALYAALNSHNDTLIIDLQSSPWVFGPMRFQGLENKVIVLEEGVSVIAKTGAFPKDNDVLFKFLDCNNISILGNGNELSMNKEEYVTGEWRHLIRIGGSRNFQIKNLILKDSGGDGIMIGRSPANLYSENIVIDSITSLNNKRQGISITSGKNITVSNSVFADTKGTMPGAGVDIEPDRPDDVLENILFDDCVFKNNYHAGIKIALDKLRSSSVPISINFKNCYLNNNASKDNPSPHAEIFLVAHPVDPVEGYVCFEGCLVENSQWGLVYARKSAAGYKVEFLDCTARNICQAGPQPAIFMELRGNRMQTEMGGFVFENLSLDYQIKAPVIAVGGSFKSSATSLRNVRGTIVLPSTVGNSYTSLNYSLKNDQDIPLQIVLKNRK